VLLFFAVLGATAVAASAASATTRPRPIQFGISGGNVRGYTVSIKPGGKVIVLSAGGGTRDRKITAARVRKLGREIQKAHLAKKRLCSGNNPDVATQYIRLGTHTYSLRGACEPSFQRVWSDLAQVAGPLPR
jgi:hypothetical protein